MPESLYQCSCNDGPHPEKDYPLINNVRRCSWCKTDAIKMSKITHFLRCKCGGSYRPLKKDMLPMLSQCSQCGDDGPFWADVESGHQPTSTPLHPIEAEKTKTIWGEF